MTPARHQFEEAVRIWAAYYAEPGKAAWADAERQCEAASIPSRTNQAGREKALERKLYDGDLPPCGFGISPIYRRRVSGRRASASR